MNKAKVLIFKATQNSYEDYVTALKQCTLFSVFQKLFLLYKFITWNTLQILTLKKKQKKTLILMFL